MTYIEEIVSTRELLEHLESHHQECPVQLLVRWFEAVDEARLDLRFVLYRAAHILHLFKTDYSVIRQMSISGHITHLAMDELVVVNLMHWNAPRFCERDSGLIVFPVRSKPPRTFRHCQNTKAENERPEKTNSHNRTPRARTADITSSNRDAVWQRHNP
jgi:hypothetical protein